MLATKFHGRMGEGRNRSGNSRRWIMREVEDSLGRLGTDWIDVYQVHRPEPSVDIDETLGALTDLVRAGKIRYLGSSTFPAHAIVEAQWTSERRGRERFATEQPPYSIFVRGIERDVLPVCERYGMGVIVWAPLASGWLSGRYRKEQESCRRAPVRNGSRGATTCRFRGTRRKLEATEALAQLAEQAGLSLVELAIAFVLRHPAVTSAIIGPRTMEHLESQLGAADVVLTPDVLDRIDEITFRRARTSTRPTPATPHRRSSTPPAAPLSAGARGRRDRPAPHAEGRCPKPLRARPSRVPA